MVTDAAAGAKGPGFISPVVRAYMRFNDRASTIVGKQCDYTMYGCNKLWPYNAV